MRYMCLTYTVHLIHVYTVLWINVWYVSHRYFAPYVCTAYCIWSVISAFSNLNRWSNSLGLFYHVPLNRDQGDWDWRLRLNDTPNATGCIICVSHILCTLTMCNMCLTYTMRLIIHALQMSHIFYTLHICIYCTLNKCLICVSYIQCTLHMHNVCVT